MVCHFIGMSTFSRLIASDLGNNEDCVLINFTWRILNQSEHAHVSFRWMTSPRGQTWKCRLCMSGSWTGDIHKIMGAWTSGIIRPKYIPSAQIDIFLFQSHVILQLLRGIFMRYCYNKYFLFQSTCELRITYGK